MPTLLCICLRPPEHGEGERNVWTRLATREAAADALRRPQCEDPGCQRAHIVALVDHGEARVIPMPPPEPPPLADELEQLYGWKPPLPEVEQWDAPAELNEPLEKPVATSPLPDKINRGHAIEVQRQIYPTVLCHPALPDAPELGPTSPLPRQQGGTATPVPAPPPSGCTGAQTDCHYTHNGTDPPERRCGVDGCDRKHLAKNLCAVHYRHQWDHLPPLPIALPYRMCETPDCLRPHLARGLCQRCYDRAKVHRRNGAPVCPSPTQPAKPVRWPTPAEIAATSLPPWHWKRRWLQKPAS